MQYYLYFSSLDWVVFIFSTFTTLTLVFSKNFRKNKNGSSVEYLLMGRRLTLPMFVATLVATWYAGIIGVTQISYEKGIYNFVTQGACWYISALIFAFFFMNKARSSEALSFPDLIEKFYGPLSARITAVMLYFKVLPVAYAIALGVFLQGFFGISLNAAIIIGTTLIAIHCIYGGLKAIIACDIAQFIFMFIAIITVIVVSYTTFGGMEYLQANLAPHYFSAKANETWSTVFVWFFVALNTTLLSPVFYQRCFAADTEKTAKIGIFISLIFWVVCDLCTTFGGLYAKAHMPDIQTGDAYLIYALAILPDGVRGLFIVGILFTVLSALDSFLFIASTILSYDLAPVRFKESSSVRHLSIIITAISTILISFCFEGRIEQAWLTLETFFMAGLFLPLVIGLVRPNVLTDYQCSSVIAISSITSVLWKIGGGEEAVNMFYIGSAISFVSITFVLIYNNCKPLEAKV